MLLGIGLIDRHASMHLSEKRHMQACRSIHGIQFIRRRRHLIILFDLSRPFSMYDILCLPACIPYKQTLDARVANAHPFFPSTVLAQLNILLASCMINLLYATMPAKMRRAGPDAGAVTRNILPLLMVMTIWFVNW